MRIDEERLMKISSVKTRFAATIRGLARLVSWLLCPNKCHQSSEIDLTEMKKKYKKGSIGFDLCIGSHVDMSFNDDTSRADALA